MNWTPDTPTFEEWMDAVNVLYLHRFGLVAEDFGDAPWRDFYDDGVKPADAFSTALMEYQS